MEVIINVLIIYIKPFRSYIKTIKLKKYFSGRDLTTKPRMQILNVREK